MHARVRLVLIGAFACAFAALGGVWIAALTTSDSGAATAPNGFEGYRAPPGAHVPDFALADQDGDRARPAGEWSIYTFVYSTCEDTCPIMTQQIRGALDDLGHDVPVYGISVDPANDTARRAQAFLADQFMTGRMRFVLGSAAELRPIWAAFGVDPQTQTKNHVARVVIVDPQGRQRLGWQASELTADALRRDLQRLGA